ncbi:ATP-binding protein [Halomonas sp. HP20-15]|uniref:sensor histidine kinase n=1 Tax=Halomonas sp. HP20-15 TaxID=3085901 RepID=UPI0029825424|nr:ATP-binding protein [Halomonas sp. HP20-15]MDW5377684.1 ATP-binding protein [Halomonas sp. HP20-15]
MNRLTKGFAIGLHARLLIWLLILLAMLWLTLWTHARHTIEDNASRELDHRLQSTATLLLRIYVGNLQTADADARPRAALNQPFLAQLMALPNSATGPQPPSFEVLSAEHGVLASSSDFPAAARFSSPGFDSRFIANQQWRIFTLNDLWHGITIRVALNQHVGTAHAAMLNHDVTQSLLWLLPAFTLLAFVSVWRGLAPLRRIEHAIARQNPLAPRPLNIDRRRVPVELREFIATLDRLMNRVREVLTRQRAFTAGAGHELRTPLAGCRAQLQVARRSRSAEGRERALCKAQQSIDHMTTLVDQLLILARLDPVAPRLDTHPMDFSEVIRRVVERIGTPRAVQLRLAMPDEPVTVIGNAPLIETLVTNLINNAIRFSPRQGTVHVALACHDGRALLRICDQGPGIAPERHERVFDPFQQGHGKADEGSGLGLAIVRAVAQAHGGQAMVHSPRDGGTEIRVTLPIADRDSAQATA